MANSQLIHLVKGFPALGIDIEQVDFTVSISILTSNQEDFTIWNSKSTASPKSILHSNSKTSPEVLINLIHFNTVIDLLFCASIESSKCIDVFISDGACTQIMSLILHWSNLAPLVFSDVVFFSWTESLLSRETSKDIDCSFANGNSVCVSTFGHLSFV